MIASQQSYQPITKHNTKSLLTIMNFNLSFAETGKYNTINHDIKYAE